MKRFKQRVLRLEARYGPQQPPVQVILKSEGESDEAAVIRVLGLGRAQAYFATPRPLNGPRDIFLTPVRAEPREDDE
ncbi:MAG: hypothetical protein JWR10_856 [Rubritepida sp.]|nr:hypothetical protein [Rubritepida sp.]